MMTCMCKLIIEKLRARCALAAIAAMLSQACTPGAAREAGPPELAHAGLAVDVLNHELLTQTDQLALPYKAAVVDQYLVVIDLGADSVLHIIDRMNGTLVRSFGRRGEGPGEFKGIWSLDRSPEHRFGLWVFDIGLLRTTYLDVKHVLGDSTRYRVRSVNFVSEAAMTGPVRTADGRFLSLGFYTQGRLGVFNAEGVQDTILGELPPASEKIRPSDRQHAFQATLAIHPRRHLLAAVLRHGSQLEIYHNDGSLLKRVDGPLPIQIETNIDFSGRLSGFRLTDHSRYGYVDAVASDRFIFALFSGRLLGAFRARATFGRYVHVFDWQGQLKRVLELDRDAIAIAVDSETTALYSVIHDPQPAILRYSLNENALITDNSS